MSNFVRNFTRAPPPARSGYTEIDQQCGPECICADPRALPEDILKGCNSPGRRRQRLIHELKRVWIFVLTFLCYMSYHAVRKPPSVVKNVWHRNCTDIERAGNESARQGNESASDDCSWAPFEKDSDYATLFGVMDNSYLFAYAVGMFLSGPLAERMNVKFCLGFGMVLSGIFGILIGAAYYLNIHNLWYFVVVMIAAGFANTSGWPPIAAILGSWFPKNKRGLIFGIWNSCTSVGNIVGAALAAAFVNFDWGMSFVAPSLLIIVLGVVTFITFSFIQPDIRDAIDDVGDIPSSSSGINLVSQSRSAEAMAAVEESEIVAVEESEMVVLVAPAKRQRETAISFLGALKIPGVVPYSLSLFFVKLVSYTFLFWLPIYIKNSTDYDPSQSAKLSICYDVGGIAGAVAAGYAADKSGRSALVCIVMLVTASPSMYLYQYLGGHGIPLGANIIILMLIGFVINGPYSLITTSVAVNLGSHRCLQGNKKALSTVSAIIDGSGSTGAAIGPLLTGLLISAFDWEVVFFMLITSNLLAVVPLVYMIIRKTNHNSRI